MGRLQKLRSSVGLTDKKLLRNGLPATGRVVEVERTTIVIGIAHKFAVCRVKVDVERDGYPPYMAQCLHPIHVREVELFQTGRQVVHVRVDPDDPDNIALDFAADAPPKKPRRSQ